MLNIMLPMASALGTTIQSFYTTGEFSALFRLKERTTREWIASKKIAVVKVGRSVRIPGHEVERLIRDGLRPASQAQSELGVHKD